MDGFDHYFAQTRCAFEQQRTHARAHAIALSSLVSLGRQTITGMLCAGAQQNMDWSAAYRLFENERFDIDALFAPSRQGVLTNLSSDAPVVACMDDTILRKRGRKVAGTSWKRDPLGPPFHTNFVWAQRFLQVSALLPESEGPRLPHQIFLKK